MTMRKHKKKQNLLRMANFSTAQLRTTLEGYGKLLGVGAVMGGLFKKIEHDTRREEALLKAARIKVQRRMYHASGGKQAYDIPVPDMTALDKARIERARSRRALLQAKRARAYAWCVNNNPALRWHDHEASVQISNVNYVDKAFLMKWRGRPA